MDKETPMKALVATDYGTPFKVAVADVPAPSAGPGQVLIQVEAAALNPFDLILMSGALREMVPLAFPFVIGMDAAGTVAALGEGVSRFAVGDPVLGWSGFTSGTVAEFTVIPDGLELQKRPNGLDAVHGAAIPESGVTAVTLIRVGEVQAGQRVLVIGATGGVGMFAVQLAASAGAEVIATAKPADRDFVRRLGANQVIDYTATDVVDAVQGLYPGGVDVVIDLVNRGDSVLTTARAARQGGRLVSPLTGPEDLGRGVQASYIQKTAEPGDLDGLAARAASGELTVEVSATHELAEGPEAVAEFATSPRHGKSVIVVSPGRST